MTVLDPSLDFIDQRVVRLTVYSDKKQSSPQQLLHRVLLLRKIFDQRVNENV